MTAVGRVARRAIRGTPTGQATTIEVVRSVEHLAALQAEWDALARGRQLPTGEHAWVLAAAETFASDGRLYVILVRDADGALCAAAALALQGRRPQRLVLLGVGQLGEPGEVLVRDDDACAALATALARAPWAVLLCRLGAGSRLADALTARMRGRGAVVRRPAPECPVIWLDESWREPEARLSSRRRSDLRRARRRADDVGTVTVDVHAPSPAEVPPLLDEAIAVEAKSWKGREGTALRHHVQLLPFYRRYAELAAERGILRIALLHIAGDPAAMTVSVETAGGLWLLKVGYDEAFARCSPGMLMTRETIAFAADRGLRSYEFLGTRAPWTDVWTEDMRQFENMGVYRAGVRGLAAAVSDARETRRNRRAEEAAA
jgi:CelD/BcsL family acetyltransferase involved in cellulose biosynthesis